MARKVRFNFIDVCIVAVVVVAVAVLGVMYNSKTDKTVEGNGGGLTYSVLVEEVDSAYVNAITEGDLVIFGNSSSDSAVVKSFVASDAINHTKNLVDGGYENSVIENRYDVVVTLEGNAVKTDDSIKIGTTEIRTGEMFEGKGKSPQTGKAYLVKGYVIGMQMDN